jgi:ketosteroid isomerase-like protein
VARPEYYGNPAGLTEDIDVVRAIYAAFAVRDLEGALDFIAPDCAIHVEGTARAAGRQGPYVGHDGLRRYFADVDSVWQKLEIHAVDYRVIPGSVIVMGHVEGRGYAGAFRHACVWTWRHPGGRATHLRVADMGPADPA